MKISIPLDERCGNRKNCVGGKGQFCKILPELLKGKTLEEIENIKTACKVMCETHGK